MCEHGAMSCMPLGNSMTQEKALRISFAEPFGLPRFQILLRMLSGSLRFHQPSLYTITDSSMPVTHETSSDA